MISLARALDAEAQARVYLIRLYPGERRPYITGVVH